jgi:hypothetical protein
MPATDPARSRYGKEAIGVNAASDWVTKSESEGITNGRAGERPHRTQDCGNHGEAEVGPSGHTFGRSQDQHNANDKGHEQHKMTAYAEDQETDATSFTEREEGIEKPVQAPSEQIASSDQHRRDGNQQPQASRGDGTHRD